MFRGNDNNNNSNFNQSGREIFVTYSRFRTIILKMTLQVNGGALVLFNSSLDDLIARNLYVPPDVLLH